MKKIKINKKVFKILLLSFFFLLLSISASQAAYLTFTPQVGIPGEFDKPVIFEGSSGTEYIAKFVSAIYSYGVSVGAILAAIMLMAGGLIWLTSGGSQEKVGKAKDIISGSIIGLFLLMGAYTILNMVNPKLVDLRIRPITKIEREREMSKEVGCCQHPTQSGFINNQQFFIRKATRETEKDCISQVGGKFFPNRWPNLTDINDETLGGTFL